MSETTTPEFSRPVAVDRLGPGATMLDLTATPAECAALAERFHILGIDSLTAKVHLRRVPGSTLFRLRGKLAAQVVQACVVTLEAVVQQVEESFELHYGEVDPEEGEILVHYDQEDPPEPILHGVIDVGEAVAEHLALGLDPFPRRADASFTPDWGDGEEPEEEEKPNPFAALAALRRKDG